MTVFLKRLALKVLGSFAVTLAALTAAARPFDVMTFAWGPSLVVAASAAVLVALEGLAGRFTGDPERPRVSE